jgi:hypothetical protein
MTADEVSAQIAHLDGMIERCEAVARRAIPIKPDMSLPRYVSRPVPAVPNVPTVPKQNRIRPPVSWEPQQRYEQIRREHGSYRPLCTGSYGTDVDRAFEECSNAPY